MLVHITMLAKRNIRINWKLMKMLLPIGTGKKGFF